MPQLTYHTPTVVCAFSIKLAVHEKIVYFFRYVCVWGGGVFSMLNAFCCSFPQSFRSVVSSVAFVRICD
jgi:hypothetical protein